MLIKLLFYLFIKPLSYLPLFALHRISDVLFFFVYYIFNYRKKVVLGNIRRSFSEKTEKEIQIIAKEFFRHFCDVMVESVRMFSMPKRELAERVKILNPELFEKYYQAGKSIALTSGHCGNWEWIVVGVSAQIEHKMVAIYKPLSNPFFEKVIKESRSRFGMELIKKGDFKQRIKDIGDDLITLVFASDQCPTGHQKAYWTNFLNQETAVMLGAEIYSKRYDYVVLITNIVKVKRGFYEVAFEIVEEHPNDTAFGEITEKHTRILESQIQANSPYWLWTHRRWKRKRTESET